MSRELKLESAGVCVFFSPREDRFAGRIELGSGSAALVAVDGPAENLIADQAGEAFDAEAWPLSPPLQDVHLEQRPDGKELALMVGRAGLSHWSISCELQPTSGELVFDVACRIKEPALWLGSSYQLSAGLQFQGDNTCGEICQEGIPLAQLSVESPAEIYWDPESQLLQIQPRWETSRGTADSQSKFPQTVRWRYKLLVLAAANSVGK